uniref:Myocardial zonula adherens protein n=1 Tax=Sphenodon punctatus TaxID=8508 RepID=A0A8D0HLT8_SPHPU
MRQGPLPPPEGSSTAWQLYHVPNGVSPEKLSHGVVYGVVHRSDKNHNKEMVVYGWSTSQLKQEMNYIKDVRETLEKVRKKMYGEYDEMKRKIQQLTSELTVSESLESHMQVQSVALDSFSVMNSSLTSASIELQKTLVDVALENTDIKDQIKNLKQTHEQSMEKLKEKQKQLETARIENELLKLKVQYEAAVDVILTGPDHGTNVECSQEANADVMREMTKKLYSQYEEKLREEEQKHKVEKETLIAETNRLLKRIGELDRLIQRMGEVILAIHKSVKITSSPSSTQQEKMATSLRERIKHLDDMVLCQQKKVKHMVEEVSFSKTTLCILNFCLEHILPRGDSLLGTNKELQDRLDYLMETQPRTDVETRDIGVGCDLLPSSTDNSSRPPEISKPLRTYTPFKRVLEFSTHSTRMSK